MLAGSEEGIQKLFSHVLVKCDVSIFNMYVLCTNHNMFQQEVKGLFIRFSKLFDSAPPIKTDNKSLGCR